jgi:ubiquinone/menaquinone biosynthesis C-methylase UbiE
MISPLIIILFLVVVAAWFGRRTLSRRRSLPCPACFSWMVDNAFSIRRTSATLDHLQLFPGMHVLDGGCGRGRLAIPIAQAVGAHGRVLAVDIQPDMLRRAKVKAGRSSVANMEFLHAGLGEGSLPRARFDRAVLSTVLGEIPDRLAALREIRSALKPGGFLLINEVIGDPHYQSLAKVKALTGEAGFRLGAHHGSWIAFSIRLEKQDDT